MTPVSDDRLSKLQPFTDSTDVSNEGKILEKNGENPERTSKKSTAEHLLYIR